MTPEEADTQSEASQRNSSPNSAVKTTTTLSANYSINTPLKLNHSARLGMNLGYGSMCMSIGCSLVNNH